MKKAKDEQECFYYSLRVRIGENTDGSTINQHQLFFIKAQSEEDANAQALKYAKRILDKINKFYWATLLDNFNFPIYCFNPETKLWISFDD